MHFVLYDAIGEGISLTTSRVRRRTVSAAVVSSTGMRMPLPVVQGVARYAVGTFTSPHPMLRCAAIPRDHLSVFRGETVVVPPHGFFLEPFVADFLHDISVGVSNRVSGFTLAHVAALCGNRRALDALTEPMLRAITSTGLTALHCAACGDRRRVPLPEQLPLLEDILKRCPDMLRATANDSRSVLHFACQTKRLDIVQYLYALDPSIVFICEKNGYTPFDAAAYRGNIELMEFLIRSEPPLLAHKSLKQLTCLHLAAMGGNTNGVKYLLEKDPALIDMVSETGGTCVYLAAFMGRLETVRYICSVKPPLATALATHNVSSLYVAALQGHVHTARFLGFTYPELLDVYTAGGRTCAHAAASKGHTDVLRMLAVLKPDILGIPTRLGASCLWLAATEGHVCTVTYLAEARPELLDMRDRQGQSCLHAAALTGKLEVVRYLVGARPAHVAVRNLKGLTPAQVAVDHPAVGVFFSTL